MARPATLLTGQWADLPLEELAPLAKEMGYDGLELACWGDHFEVDKAIDDDGYVERQREILERNGLECFAIGNHLVGQGVCDPIDERHRATLPQHVWADGVSESVRQRAAEEIRNTPRAAARLGVEVVTSFTGSSSGTSSTIGQELTLRLGS
jgi:sugar phosphate isomerase/epimerase